VTRLPQYLSSSLNAAFGWPLTGGGVRRYGVLSFVAGVAAKTAIIVAKKRVGDLPRYLPAATGDPAAAASAAGISIRYCPHLTDGLIITQNRSSWHHGGNRRYKAEACIS